MDLTETICKIVLQQALGRGHLVNKNSLKIVTLMVISIRAYQHENRNKTVASHDPLCGLPFDPLVWLTYSVRRLWAVF